jgi:hypothetical protein
MILKPASAGFFIGHATLALVFDAVDKTVNLWGDTQPLQ